MIVAYDGTDFEGWQPQPHKNTVCDTLSHAFRHIFHHDAHIFGGSRTDAGVHALGQVAQLETQANIPLNRMLKAWNDGVGPSITIRSLEQVPDDFFPMHDVLYKEYYYHLFLKRPLPFIARYGWFYHFIESVDVEKFAQCLMLYKGEHDFRSFCKLEEERSTIRTVHEISMQYLPRFGALQIKITGSGFLRFQIRRMIGYAIDVARRKNLSVDYIAEILKNPNPQQTLLKAEASGLCLRRIVYSSKS